MVVSELRGEKIDIIPWNPEPARFVAKALSPARVREVYLDDDAKEATVVVPDDQLALAIGKEGMNARLAHRLTGWKIDIVSDTQFAEQEAEAAFGGGEPGDEMDTSGRCAAILNNGKRCPNASLPGSKYCGVPAHQELATREPVGHEDDNELVDEPEPELEALADESPSEAVSLDGAVLGEPEQGDAFPAGPGDAPVEGPDETLESGGEPVVRVVDDPNQGVPIEYVTSSAETNTTDAGEAETEPAEAGAREDE
jgi:N utilization substance protein A